MNSRNLVIASMVLAVLLAGCSLGPVDSPALEGTQWLLVTLGGDPPLAGTEPSAEFSADQISGSAGCNTYFGTYTVNGDSIKFGDVASTEMYCMEPEGVMEREQAFLTALASITSYRLAREGLELLDGTGTVILAFEPAP